MRFSPSRLRSRRAERVPRPSSWRARAEAALDYGAVADLMADVFRDPDVAGALPAPQRRALEVALLLDEPGDGPPVDARAVGVALLTALRACADRGPLVVAVDDVHWLDPASALALHFAARRLTDAPVAFLLARRTPSPDGPLDLDRTFATVGLEVVEIGPLSLGAVHRLIHDRLAAEGGGAGGAVDR